MEPDVMGMGIRHWNWLDDISSAWPIGLSSEDMTLNRMKPDKLHTQSWPATGTKVAASTTTHRPMVRQNVINQEVKQFLRLFVNVIS